jgi:membrane protease YdiL (CAAX protease family)
MTVFWRFKDIAVFLFLAIPCLVLGLLLSKWIPAAAGVRQMIAQLLFYGLWFLCLKALFLINYQQPFWASLGFHTPLPQPWNPAILGFPLALGTALLGTLLKAPVIDPPFRDLMSTRTTLVLFALAGVCAGPLAEELFFRGLVLPWMQQQWGTTAAILLTALPFGLLHGAQYQWSWQYILLVGLAGAVFGWVRHHWNSTLASFLTHASYNLTFLTLALLR